MTENPNTRLAAEGSNGNPAIQEALATIGALAKALRLEENLSQADLATRVGLSRSAIQKLEGGGGTVGTLVAVLLSLDVLDEVLATLEKDISRKVKNKVLRGGRASSRGGFSK